MINILFTIVVICSYKPDYVCEEINKRPKEEESIEVLGEGYKEKDIDKEEKEDDDPLWFL